jgi:hypothetical protein
VYKYEIEKVWVQFKGLPKEFREFPIIWAIASILGVPRSVDTKFTKAFGRARLKVAVLDSSLIPVLVDVVIGDYVYQLHFGVEQGMSDGEPVLIDLDSTYEDEDPKGGETEPKDADTSGLWTLMVKGRNSLTVLGSSCLVLMLSKGVLQMVLWQIRMLN